MINSRVISSLERGRYCKQVKILSCILPHKARVLDLGCGNGFTTALLATVRKDLEVMGMDIHHSSDWRKLTKSGCKFQLGDALNLPLKNESIGSVVSFGVVEHVDGDRFLKEVYRVLVRGGYNIIFNLPRRYSLSESTAALLGIWHHSKRYTRGEILRLLKGDNFKVLDIKKGWLIPAQMWKLNITIIDKHQQWFDKLDGYLNKTPLNHLAQSFTVISMKG